MHLSATLRNVVAAVLALPVLAIAAFAGGGGSQPAATASDSMGPRAVPGIDIKNFGVINAHIYRGEQPGETDYVALKALGISTIVDLRNDAKPFARAAAQSAGLKYVNIPMDDGDKPYDEQIEAFLKSVTDPTNGKCYVHCAGGRHRTGATIAVYRMAIQGWSADAAYREMKAYDFYTRWGHGGYKTYVFDYYKRMRENPSSVPLAYSAADNQAVLDAATYVIAQP